MQQIKETLFDRDPSKMESPVKDVGLRTPKEARKEVETLRDQLAQVRDYKEQQRFLGRRQRLMSTGWRHGVVGIDDADSAATQVFYQSARNEKASAYESKDQINKRRTKRKSRPLIIVFPLQIYLTVYLLDYV